MEPNRVGVGENSGSSARDVTNEKISKRERANHEKGVVACKMAFGEEPQRKEHGRRGEGVGNLAEWA
jgi:hypothetical protein